MEEKQSLKNTFDKLLLENDAVFIVPHNRPDFDAIAAAIGISIICKKYKKKSYIVVENRNKLRPEIKKVMDEISGRFDILDADDVPEMMSDTSLMIAVDCNKTVLIPTNDFIDKFNSLMVIDHHKPDNTTIKTPNVFIMDKVTSASEIVAGLIYDHKIKISPDYATYLLAGMYLDSSKLSRNVGDHTYEIAQKLKDSGADPTIANNMFLDDFDHDRAIQKLVDNTDFPTFTFAIASDIQDSGRIYEVEDIAMAADYLLKYKVNATFAMAYIDDETVSISARSKGSIDVDSIMKLFNGGGNEHSAGARVKGKSICEIKAALTHILTPGFSYLNAPIDQAQAQINAEVEEEQPEGMSLSLHKKNA